MTDFNLYYKPHKLEQFRKKDKYVIPCDCVVLGDWKPTAPVEVQGFLKVYGDFRLENGSLNVSGYIFAELGIYAQGDVISGAYMNAGDSIYSAEGNIVAKNDIRSTGNLVAPNGYIETGEGFGIAVAGKIDAKTIKNGANVFAGVNTWANDPDAEEHITVEKIQKPSKVKLGKVITKKTKK